MRTKQPPLGLKPREVWEEERLWNIDSAIKRYLNAGKQIPVQWIEEYNELVGRNEQ